MKLNDSRREQWQNAAGKPHVLIPLIFGSIALHLLILWALAQFPAPLARAPKMSTEVQLSEFSAPPVKPPELQTSPATPSLTKTPDAPRRAQTPSERPTQTTRPEQPRRQIAPTAPLVRSTREIAKTGVTAENPVVALPTAAPPKPNRQRAPDVAAPRPQQSAAPTGTQAAKPAPRPTVGARQESGNVQKKTGIPTKKPVVPLPTAVSGPTPSAKTQLAKASPLAGKSQQIGNDANQENGGSKNSISDKGNSQNSGGESEKSRGQNSINGSGNSATNGAIGELFGIGDGNGGGPFGLNGGADEGPRRIVYVLDISYSMEPRLERAKKELAEALDGLQPGESFNIIGFYGNVIPFNRGLVEATPDNIAKGRAFLYSLRLKRYTNLELAFETTFAARSVNVVVLITDGVPTYGLGSPDFSLDRPDIGANFAELAQRVRQLNLTKARIYTVGIVGKNPNGTDASFQAAELLQRISAESGGTFKTVRIDAAPQSDSL